MPFTGDWLAAAAQDAQVVNEDLVYAEIRTLKKELKFPERVERDTLHHQVRSREACVRLLPPLWPARSIARPRPLPSALPRSHGDCARCSMPTCAPRR